MSYFILTDLICSLLDPLIQQSEQNRIYYFVAKYHV